MAVVYYRRTICLSSPTSDGMQIPFRAGAATSCREGKAVEVLELGIRFAPAIPVYDLLERRPANWPEPSAF